MTDSLYARLGGYDGIAMFATTLVGQARQDEQLERFWANRGEDRITRECQLLTDYLVNKTGGQKAAKRWVSSTASRLSLLPLKSSSLWI
ncbi:hypothetical protein ACFL0N_03000 [Pseudomonadota bacterium]